LGFTKEDRRETVERNREVFLENLGAKSKENVALPLVTLRQIHSDLIHAVTAVPRSPLVGDGIITDTPGLVLGVHTADCLPVILVDPKRKAVGVFHAGWRGTVQRIVEKGVGQMQRQFGSKPRDIKAAIGPGVHGCCYEVGEEVAAGFPAEAVQAGTGRPHLDLPLAARLQLVAAGIRPANIHDCGACTACESHWYYSFRRDGAASGRHWGVAALRAR